MTPKELQQALHELSAFRDSQPYPADEPDAATPMLYNIAIDPPFGDNNCDHHDRDAVYLCWLTTSDLDKLKADSKGRMSYWSAGWYPDAEALIDTPGGDDEDSIWEKEDDR